MVRGIHSIHLPFCSDKMKLREMGEAYNGLTDLEVTFGGGIPSLIYVRNQSYEMSVAKRFELVMDEMMIKDKRSYLATNPTLIPNFLSELIYGKQQETLFTCFSDIFVSDEGKVTVRYPLPYVACIWEWLKDDRLKHLVETLSQYAKELEGGKDWEVIIVTALFLRFLHCQYVPVNENGSPNLDPFNIATDGVENIHILDIPGEVRTINDALGHIGLYCRSKPMVPKTILIALPRYNKFPDIDGLILYQGNNSMPLRKYGYQAKTKRGSPRHNIPEEIDQCFLLRGKAPAQRSYQKEKWYYVEESVLREMLGFTLQPFYPNDWGNVADSDEFD